MEEYFLGLRYNVEFGLKMLDYPYYNYLLDQPDHK